MLRTALALSIAALCSVPAASRALELAVYGPPTANLGSSFNVEIHVLGSPELGDFAAPSVRAFEVDLAFDDSLLAFTEASCGDFLGTPGSQALVSSADDAGTLDLKEVSLLSSSTLDFLQPQDFMLARLTFQAVAPGLATFELTQSDLADTDGLPFYLAGSGTASVEVVPEPGSTLLATAGVLGLALCRWLSRRKLTQ